MVATGSAAEALQAVIYYNATHAVARHGPISQVCDTTHCMVYRGDAKRDPKMATMAKYLKIKGLVAELEPLI